jgi:lysophospholipase L1-like esterase
MPGSVEDATASARPGREQEDGMARVRFPALLAAVLAALIATVTFAVGSARAESNGGVRVMPLGDSITDGFNVPGGYRIDLWQKFVAGGFTVDFVGSLSNGPAALGDHDHEGHSGWRIDQIDANIVTWLRTFTPRTILLHIGTNDMIQNSSGATTRLGTLLDHITATAPDAEVFVATIIPLAGNDSAVRAFNAAIPGLVQARVNAGRHLHLVDMFSALTTADLADGVHPNAGGYAKMANVWFAALRSVPGSISGGPTTPPTSPPAGGGCAATYRTVGSWGTGLQGEVTVRNSGSQALTGWTVAMTLGGGQTVGNMWGGTPSANGGTISVANASYNGSVPGGASATFGFILDGGTAPPAVAGCSAR